MSGRCIRGVNMHINVTHAKAELARIARMATRNGAVGERAQRALPQARAAVDRAQSVIPDHIAGCEQCQTAEVAA